MVSRWHLGGVSVVFWCCLDTVSVVPCGRALAVLPWRSCLGGGALAVVSRWCLGGVSVADDDGDDDDGGDDDDDDDHDN